MADSIYHLVLYGRSWPAPEELFPLPSPVQNYRNSSFSEHAPHSDAPGRKRLSGVKLMNWVNPSPEDADLG